MSELEQDSVALPDGVRLLHIGPHKTGTTTVQAALHQNRERLTSMGVAYAGLRAHPMTAAIGASTNRRLPSNSAKAGREAWEILLEEIRSSEARAMVLSSEFFCEANSQRAAAIVEDLDADRVHVVITLRPLVNIVSSQWQQYIQNRAVLSYDDWLQGVLHDESSRITPTFWQRHRHDRLVQRWADIVGPKNLTVIILDENDHGMLLRSFERLLRLERDTLVAQNVTSNRSLTLAEVELLRTFNRHYLAEGLSFADYTELIRFGAARHLQARRPSPLEESVSTPQWAVDRALAVGSEMAAAIAQSGVNIIGSTAALAAPNRLPRAGSNPTIDSVSQDVAAAFLAGVAIQLGTVRGIPAGDQRTEGPIEAAVRERHRRRRISTHLERTNQEIARLQAEIAHRRTPVLLRILRRARAQVFRRG